MYPHPIQKLINAFQKLPSVGGRTAERFVFSLLKSGKKDVAELTNALTHLMTAIKSCAICWDFSDTDPCVICADTKRDTQTICVVEEPQDLQAIEKTGAYDGRYHVLRGLISADGEFLKGTSKMKELVARAAEKNTNEVILALSPDMPGETTMMFLEKKLLAAAPHITVSRLARGLPMGSDLQYADEITLSSALKHRIASEKK